MASAHAVSASGTKDEILPVWILLFLSRLGHRLLVRRDDLRSVTEARIDSGSRGGCSGRVHKGLETGPRLRGLW
jgi:hypothetical protein